MKRTVSKQNMSLNDAHKHLSCVWANASASADELLRRNRTNSRAIVKITVAQSVGSKVLGFAGRKRLLSGALQMRHG